MMEWTKTFIQIKPGEFLPKPGDLERKTEDGARTHFKFSVMCVQYVSETGGRIVSSKMDDLP